MHITKRSILTGVAHTREIDVDPVKLDEWRNNKRIMIQDQFPHLNDDDREFLISGITPEEWNATFKEE